jgi:hypothetical protein
MGTSVSPWSKVDAEVQRLTSQRANWYAKRQTMMSKQQATMSEQQGKAVQVDPINPKLKPPQTKRLKLNYDELLSKFGIKFNLRRYSKRRCQNSKQRISRSSSRP